MRKHNANSCCALFSNLAHPNKLDKLDQLEKLDKLDKVEKINELDKPYFNTFYNLLLYINICWNSLQYFKMVSHIFAYVTISLKYFSKFDRISEYFNSF